MISRRFSRREFLGLATATTAGAVLAACAPPAPTSTEPPTEGSQEPVEEPEEAPHAPDTGKITIWTWCCIQFEPREGETEADTAKAWFIEDSGGVEPEATVLGYGDFLTALRAAIPAAEGPDTFMLNWQVVQPYADEAFLLALDDLATSEWGDWKAEFTPSIIDEVEALGQEDGSGNAYFIPVYGQCLGMFFYDTELFEQAGVGVPGSWTELGQTCETLKQSGIGPIVTAGTENWVHVDWFKALAEVAAPGRIDSFEAGEASLTDPDLLQTAVLYDQMWREGWFPEETSGISGAGASQMFIAQQAAMALGGTHFAGGMNPKNVPPERIEATERWGMFLPPGGKGLIATAVGWAITSSSQNPDGAWEWLKFWSAGRGQQRIADLPEFVSNVNFQMTPVGTAADENILKPLAEQMNTGPNTRRWLKCAALIDQVGPVWQGIMTDQISPQEAMHELQEVFDKQC
jgi:raffinose/stachyose/melibiose transport system substrate-binding protein